MTPITGHHPCTCFYSPEPKQNHRAGLITDVRRECERLATCGARVSNGKGE
jgi:hypothetical protein